MIRREGEEDLEEKGNQWSKTNKRIINCKERANDRKSWKDLYSQLLLIIRRFWLVIKFTLSALYLDISL